MTQTAGSAARLHYEKAHKPTAEISYVQVPTGFTSYPKDNTPPPRQFVERFFNVPRWTDLPQSGHFAGLEAPGPLATQRREFFLPYRRGWGGAAGAKNSPTARPTSRQARPGFPVKH